MFWYLDKISSNARRRSGEKHHSAPYGEAECVFWQSDSHELITRWGGEIGPASDCYITCSIRDNVTREDMMCSSQPLNYNRTSPTPAWSTFRPVSVSRKFFSATARKKWHDETPITLKYLLKPYWINLKDVIVFTVHDTHLMHGLLFNSDLPSCSSTLTSLLRHFSIWQVLAVRSNLERESRTYNTAHRSQVTNWKHAHVTETRGVMEEVSGRDKDQGITVPQRWAWVMPYIPQDHMVLHHTGDLRLGLHLTTAWAQDTKGSYGVRVENINKPHILICLHMKRKHCFLKQNNCKTVEKKWFYSLYKK